MAPIVWQSETQEIMRFKDYRVIKGGEDENLQLAKGVANLGRFANMTEINKYVEGLERRGGNYIYNPPLSRIFVFGSNQAGRHGKGAALYARDNYAAVQGQAEGFQGRAYAIPTRTASFKSLTLDEIAEGLKRFKEFAADNLQMTFVLTPIGCGLAGYSIEEMLPVVESMEFTVNVVYHKDWIMNFD